ncbi:MAG: competence/damage-inducible protein A, partial [Alphaproteobacteria bacterium]
QNNIVTAAFLVIGDEILSGRTADLNINFLAKNLTELGIILKEVRVVGDYENEIIEAVNALRLKYNYVFTSGGIGPTHDDISSLAIAKAFNQKLVLNSKAEEILYQFYGKNNVNEARLKMAMVPEFASLLDNPVSSAPGFFVENVFVLAGVPKIFQAMFNCCKTNLKFGNKIFSKEIVTNLMESIIAKDLTDLQNEYPNLSIGSYPFENGTSLVFRGVEPTIIDLAISKMSNNINKIKTNSIIEIK